MAKKKTGRAKDYFAARRAWMDANIAVARLIALGSANSEQPMLRNAHDKLMEASFWLERSEAMYGVIAKQHQ